MSPTLSFRKETIHINAAEFLAALTTIDTFAKYCKGMITILVMDNTSAKAWLDSARCPKHPFDRCARSTHFLMLEQNRKIKSQWVSLEDNILADQCSRNY